MIINGYINLKVNLNIYRINMRGKMLKKAYMALSFILIGFCGGATAPWVLGWFKSTVVPTPANAITIANTYIVFITVIFIGVTVVLAIVGYVFTQEFSTRKDMQVSQLFSDLKQLISTDEEKARKFVEAILENKASVSLIDDMLISKIKELRSSINNDSGFGGQKGDITPESLGVQLLQNADGENHERN